MSVGTITQAGRDFVLVEWSIPNFNQAFRRSSIKSPDFSFQDLTWHLQLQSDYFQAYSIAMRVHKTDTPIRPKIMSVNFGLQKGNVTLTDSETVIYLFDCPYQMPNIQSTSFLTEDDLLCSESSNTVTITCRLRCAANQAQRQDPLRLKSPPTLFDSVPLKCAGNPAETVSRPLNSTGSERVSSRFGELFASKKHCDVTLKVKGKEFQAHRIVLVAQSPVFAAMFEHETSEVQTGIVTVPDCDPGSFGDFLRYLYTGGFGGVTPGNAHHLYVTADKYDVPELKSYCVSFMAKNLAIENVCDVASLTDQYEEVELMSSAQNFFSQNVKKIFTMPDWVMLMQTNSRLANRLLQKMADDRHL